MQIKQLGIVRMDYLSLLVSAFFIYMYNNVFMVVIPLLLTAMGGTGTLAGVQAMLFLVTAILLRFFFGPLADTYGRRMTMLLGSISFLATSVLFLHVVEVWQVLVLRIVQGVGLAAYFPAAIATAAACAGIRNKGVYIGILRMVASFSLMVGPVIALFLIQNYGYHTFFQGIAVSAFLGLLAIFFIPAPVLGPEKHAGKENSMSLRQKCNFLPLLKKCPLILGTTFTTAISYGVFMSFAALFIKEQASAINAGFFFTLYSAGGMVANGVIGWLSDRFGRLQLIVCCLMSLGIGIIMFALLPNVLFFLYPAGLFSGIGYYGSIAVLMAWMTEKVESTECTAALSLQQNALDFGIAFGSVVFGTILACLGNGSILYQVMGVLYLGYALFIFFTEKKDSKQPA